MFKFVAGFFVGTTLVSTAMTACAIIVMEVSNIYEKETARVTEDLTTNS
jgi:hypothetical protein